MDDIRAAETKTARNSSRVVQTVGAGHGVKMPDHRNRPQLQDENKRLRAELAAAQKPDCVWTQDEDRLWHTACHQLQEFIVDSPWGKRYTFCPYCGGRIEEKKVEEAKHV